MSPLTVNKTGLPTEKVSIWLCDVLRSHPMMASQSGWCLVRGREVALDSTLQL